jgi:hypothetical protein
MDGYMKSNVNKYSGSCKLVALELDNSCFYIVATKLHELHTYIISHRMSCVNCNSSDLSNNIRVIKICLVAMKLQVVIVTQKANCKANSKSPYFS